MPKRTKEGELYFLAEVATATGRPVGTLRRWIREGKVSYGKRYEKSSGKLLFTASEMQTIVSYANGIRRA